MMEIRQVRSRSALGRCPPTVATFTIPITTNHLAGGLVRQGLSVAVNSTPLIHVEARQINAIR